MNVVDAGVVVELVLGRLDPAAWGDDATCVALAEAIGAGALLTADRRLASAPGIRCAVMLV